MSHRIDSAKCMACGMCADICPFKAIKYHIRSGSGYVAPYVEHGLCKGCGKCSEDCPADAIKEMP